MGLILGVNCITSCLGPEGLALIVIGLWIYIAHRWDKYKEERDRREWSHLRK